MQFFVDNAQTIFTLVGALILYIYHLLAQHIPAERRKYIEMRNAIRTKRFYEADAQEIKKSVVART